MTKIQNLKRLGHWCLRFGYCLLFGACYLVLQIWRLRSFSFKKRQLVLCPTNKLQNDCHSRAEPAPVQTGAGVQFKVAWIPAFAGMTNG